MTQNFPQGSYVFVLPWSIEHVGGVNQVVLNLALTMQELQQVRPIILIADWNARQPIWGQFQGVDVVRWRIRSYSPEMGIKEKVAFYLWERKFQTQFRRFCAEYRVRVINPHYPGATAASLFRATRVKQTDPISIFLSFHGADLTAFAHSSHVLLAYWKQFLSDVEHIVLCSKDLQTKLHAQFGLNLRASVIHNGVDLEGLLAKQASLAPQSDRVILNVAKFEEKKGQDILIQAFSLIASDYPDVRLVLIGAKDKAIFHLQRLVVENGLKEKVKFLFDIPHDEVMRYFQQASMFVLPSRQEPFGIVILESGVFSLPVVASDVGGVPEILTNNQNGYLVPSENIAAFADAMRRILNDSKSASQMGQQLHAHVAQNFSWKTSTQKYLSLID